MIVEPSEEDLFWRQTKKLLKGLILVQKSVKFWVELNVDFAQQTTANNLPDQSEYQVLADLNDISRSNVHDRTTDTLGGLNDDVVVLSVVESVQSLDLLSWSVQHTLIDGIWHGVVDQLGENKSVLAVVEHLEGVGWEWEQVPNIWVACEDGIDVSGKLSTLILVDVMHDVRV